MPERACIEFTFPNFTRVLNVSRNVFILPSQCFPNPHSSSDQQLSAKQLPREIRLAACAAVPWPKSALRIRLAVARAPLKGKLAFGCQATQTPKPKSAFSTLANFLSFLSQSGLHYSSLVQTSLFPQNGENSLKSEIWNKKNNCHPRRPRPHNRTCCGPFPLAGFLGN